MNITRFTVLDLRELFDKRDADRFIMVLNAANLSVAKKIVYVPFTHRSGVKSTQRSTLNVFDVNSLIDLYEDRLTSLNHRHVHKKTLLYVQRLHTLKRHLDEKVN